MKRSDFLKSIGLGSAGIILPKNPFLQEQDIKIYDNYLRGLHHYSFKSLKNKMKEGDHLNVVREQSNEYDSFAIAVYYNELKLGYIAAYENIVLSNMLDKGVKLKAVISEVNKDDVFRGVAIEIFAPIIVPTEKLFELMPEEFRADDANDVYRNGFEF